MTKSLTVTALAHCQHFLCQTTKLPYDQESQKGTPAGSQKKSGAETWVCFNLGSTSEFKNKIKNINSFMSVSVLKGWAMKNTKLLDWRKNNEWKNYVSHQFHVKNKKAMTSIYATFLCFHRQRNRQHALRKVTVSLMWHLLIKLHQFVI